MNTIIQWGLHDNHKNGLVRFNDEYASRVLKYPDSLEYPILLSNNKSQLVELLLDDDNHGDYRENIEALIPVQLTLSYEDQNDLQLNTYHSYFSWDITPNECANYDTEMKTWYTNPRLCAFLVPVPRHEDQMDFTVKLASRMKSKIIVDDNICMLIEMSWKIPHSCMFPNMFNEGELVVLKCIMNPST